MKRKRIRNRLNASSDNNSIGEKKEIFWNKNSSADGFFAKGHPHLWWWMVLGSVTFENWLEYTVIQEASALSSIDELSHSAYPFAHLEKSEWKWKKRADQQKERASWRWLTLLRKNSSHIWWWRVLGPAAFGNSKNIRISNANRR